MIKIEDNKYIPVINKPYYINNEEKEIIEKTSLYIYSLVNRTLKVKLKNNKECINLMRIDYAWDIKGNLKVLELNTAGQQGWILIKESEKRGIKDKTLSPDINFLPNYLINTLGNDIAIISSYTENDILNSDTHSNIEIVELKLLIEKIKSINKKCKVINLDENIIDKIKEYNPTGIYWRGNHSIKNDLDISFKKKIYKEIDKKYKQIPSFGSLFESDNKSFLKNIKDDIRNVIPKTFNPFKNNIKNLIKDELVLKPDNSCAGQDIIFGKDCSYTLWNKYLDKISIEPNEWVLQQKCELKKDEEGNYFDIAVYISNFKNGRVEGYISRTSKDKIVNVGHGGALKPVILKDNDNLEIKKWNFKFSRFNLFRIIKKVLNLFF